MKHHTLRMLAALLACILTLSAVPFAMAACPHGVEEGMCETCTAAASEEDVCDHAVATSYIANNNGTHKVSTTGCDCGEKTASVYTDSCMDFDADACCDLCGGVMPDADCDHEVQTYYTANNDGTHKVESTACDCGKVAAITDDRPCIDGNRDRYCDLCGEKIPEDISVCEHPANTVVVVANNDGTHVRKAVCTACGADIATRDENCRGEGTCIDCGAKMPEQTNSGIFCEQNGHETTSSSEVMTFVLKGAGTTDVDWTFSISGSANATLNKTTASGTASPSVTVSTDEPCGVAKVTATATWDGGKATDTFCISFYSRASKTVYVKDGQKSFTFMNKNMFSKVGQLTGDAVKNMSLYSFLTDGCATQVCLYESNRENKNVGAITYTTTGKDRYEADSYNYYNIAKLNNLVFTVLGTGTFKLSYDLYETVGNEKFTTTTGTINIVVGKAAADADNEIVYNTSSGKDVTLSVEDFNNYWKAHVNGVTADYVTFSSNGTTGLLYLDTQKRGTVESSYMFKLVYQYAEENTYPLKGVTYMPNPNKENYTDNIDFVIRSKSGKVLNGVLKIVVGDAKEEVTAQPDSFSDVKSSDWFYNAVSYVAENGIMGGVSETAFSPNTNLSRAMVATVLYRMAGSPAVNGVASFSDVQSTSAWYYNAVCWAAQNGIVNGTSDTTFSPDANITRQDLAVMLYRFAKDHEKADVSVGENTNILSYEDVASVSEYATSSLQWACGAGILKGAEGKLNPTGTATRAEAAAMLQRYLVG